MATKLPGYTWENGFRQPSSDATPWVWPQGQEMTDADDYVTPPDVELVSSPSHNSLGINVVRNWPTLYDGTNSPHGVPSWWAPEKAVDVLICGAGPSGLEVAVSLARQGVSFRIIDKADGPLTAGRADGVQPRFLETVALWGLASEIHEEGPLIERTALYKDGKKLLFNRSHQSDSRYRGLHIITQGQIERIYIRDLARQKVLVERSSIVSDFKVDETSGDATHPVCATVRNNRTGEEEVIRAKFLVGSDGAASSIRKSLKVPFDGVSTDIYWGIMDCIFETDYPHAWVFGSVISSKHGGCVIIPREDGYIRLYTQLDVSQTGHIATSRQASDPTFAESGGNVDVHSITPEEVLEQANRIFAPYKLKFGAPLSWFAIWKISERVARSYSSPDMRVHLVGDAAHVHSVMGAFGLNASILDAANLAWKIGLAAKDRADIAALLPTYETERRKHAVRIIEVSGTYLRFICGSTLPLPDFRNISSLEADDRKRAAAVAASNGANEHTDTVSLKREYDQPNPNGAHGVNGDDETAPKKDLEFLASFFKAHGQFLLGVDCRYDESVIAPPVEAASGKPPAIAVKNGVRAPNPRVCFSDKETGYLYDKFAGAPRFQLVLFASTLAGTEVRRQVNAFLANLAEPKGFYMRLGGEERFNVVLVVKRLPFEWESSSDWGQSAIKAALPKGATVVYDDRAPDEDAHTTWGVNHSTGGLAVVRPDLWVSITAFPADTDRVAQYFDAFLK
ncbi:FAD/NAD(P)-binding domain-containing protein [Sodiomyces alkalinus F11]|uniref:FAD/NAD(P)-binding domain-containing protein n=1 Tax=Sodiomyces alkalinus (strain CBS 110278 / VKM F-3762 / F11) TaxID=1314773 RepID=A0A3N2PLF0_SODAK|nr:FAD/NAD(P)-binding domain-containing protein [Sodiomyces alkalinus F11]ROT35240.1 FAD/NAD(P)-binding domain-containing protein [Sodiomyces alkalinus F11]